MRLISLQHARRLLCSLQDHILETLVKARARYAATFHHAVAVTAADLSY
ncbi:MAG TPA: hypothetical protein PLN52_16755 [Opitutaceae bacterium]|nr:hypothetical protein [Opitutaceae bacterium]